MMSVQFFVKLSLVLLAGSLTVLLSRRASAGSRHRLCVIALLSSLVLPLSAWFPQLTVPVSFRFVSFANGGASSVSVATPDWRPGRLVLGSAVVLLHFVTGHLYLRLQIRTQQKELPTFVSRPEGSD